jgi:tRNA 2-selenouridine synthase
LVWDALRCFDPEKPVYVESESKKVGNVSIPTALVERMRISPCLDLTLSMDERVALLLEDYDFFVTDSDHFCNRLDALTAIRGKAVVDEWKHQVIAGNIAPVVQDLLTLHYDPVYLQSMQRNFSQYAQAQSISSATRSVQSMGELAQHVLSPALQGQGV